MDGIHQISFIVALHAHPTGSKRDYCIHVSTKEENHISWDISRPFSQKFSTECYLSLYSLVGLLLFGYTKSWLNANLGSMM